MTLERFTERNQVLTIISEKNIENYTLKKEGMIIKHINTLFNNIYEPGEFLSLDEGMMAFKGKMKNRIYNPMNPDNRGMKFYV
jgi:hypothetical protein